MGEFFGLPYDYYSVMHYHSSAFSNCGWSCITIQTLDEKMQSASTTYNHNSWIHVQVIGRGKTVSEGDIQLVKKLYNCPTTPTQSVTTSLPSVASDPFNLLPKDMFTSGKFFRCASNCIYLHCRVGSYIWILLPQMNLNVFPIYKNRFY